MDIEELIPRQTALSWGFDPVSIHDGGVGLIADELYSLAGTLDSSALVLSRSDTV